MYPPESDNMVKLLKLDNMHSTPCFSNSQSVFIGQISRHLIRVMMRHDKKAKDKDKKQGKDVDQDKEI